MSFEFDCPRCGERCAIGAHERGRDVVCAGCRLAFPGPNFPVRTFGFERGNAPHLVQHAHGNTQTRSVRQSADTPRRERSDETDGPGAKWLRPVAKVFTAAERSYSLHHLMLGVRRLFRPDPALPPAGRRRFEFYCGACGRLQAARVWDIASQTCCVWCGELMIVPCPAHARRPTGDQPASVGLHCPRCGAEAAVSDRNRLRHSYCTRCRIWF
jgi:hypothetical protein